VIPTDGFQLRFFLRGAVRPAAKPSANERRSAAMHRRAPLAAASAADAVHHRLLPLLPLLPSVAGRCRPLSNNLSEAELAVLLVGCSSVADRLPAQALAAARSARQPRNR